MGHPLLIEYDNAVGSDDFRDMVSFTVNATENQWSLMNNEEETGAFWLNKRMIIDGYTLPSWHQKLVSLREYIDFNNITEPLKVQRFGIGDKLGPLRDSEHSEDIKHGCILFLNNPVGSEIYFPEYNYKVEAKENRLVVYPATTSYEIRGPQANEYLYFSTVFFNIIPGL